MVRSCHVYVYMCIYVTYISRYTHDHAPALPSSDRIMVSQQSMLIIATTLHGPFWWRKHHPRHSGKRRQSTRKSIQNLVMVVLIRWNYFPWKLGFMGESLLHRETSKNTENTWPRLWSAFMLKAELFGFSQQHVCLPLQLWGFLEGLKGPKEFQIECWNKTESQIEWQKIYQITCQIEKPSRSCIEGEKEWKTMMNMLHTLLIVCSWFSPSSFPMFLMLCSDLTRALDTTLSYAPNFLDDTLLAFSWCFQRAWFYALTFSWNFQHALGSVPLENSRILLMLHSQLNFLLEYSSRLLILRSRMSLGTSITLLALLWSLSCSWCHSCWLLRFWKHSWCCAFRLSVETPNTLFLLRS